MGNKEPLWTTDKELGAWYRGTPKWVLANALRQLAALQSEAGCDLGLQKGPDGWFPIAAKECKTQRALDMTR